MPTIDVIGDIHGHADKLRGLLSRLGYEQSGGVYSSPDRTAIFVGDLIDRGDAIGEVIEIVAGMLRAGSAQIVMGNHEFNALCYDRPDRKGRYLREHNDKNDAQHKETCLFCQESCREGAGFDLVLLFSALAGSRFRVDRSRRLVTRGDPIAWDAVSNTGKFDSRRHEGNAGISGY